MVGVQRCQRRDGNYFASSGPLPKEGGLKVAGFLGWLDRDGFFRGKNVQGRSGSGAGDHIRVTDGKGPR